MIWLQRSYSKRVRPIGRFTVYYYFSAILLILLSISKLLFFPVLVSRVYLGLTRSRILLVWVMLELNIIRVLPLLRFDGGVFRGELRIKYFLIQA